MPRLNRRHQLTWITASVFFPSIPLRAEQRPVRISSYIIVPVLNASTTGLTNLHSQLSAYSDPDSISGFPVPEDKWLRDRVNINRSIAGYPADFQEIADLAHAVAEVSDVP